jgi:hypothetical protein
MAADICDEVITNESLPKYRRPPEGFPGYAAFTHIEMFPFIHTVALLDLDRSAAVNISSLVRDAARTLKRGNVMSVRNRIPHGGGDFPSSVEFGTAISAIEQAITALEESGACPLVALYAGSSSDGYGRFCVEWKDYRGRTTVLYGPSELEMCGLPSSETPQAIFKMARVRDSAEVLRFSFEEDSEFSRIWSNYPNPPSDILAIEGAERNGVAPGDEQLGQSET